MIYPFWCEACKRDFDRQFEPAKVPTTAPCPDCGVACYQDWEAKFSTRDAGDIYRYHESLALAVHPKTIPQQRAFDKTHGLDVDYTKRGKPIFRSKSERLRYAKARGFADADRYA